EAASFTLGFWRLVTRSRRRRSIATPHPPRRERGLASVEPPTRSLMLLGDADQLAKDFLVVHRQVGEDLPVHLDAGLLQPRDQSAVGEAVLPGGGVDPRDPKPPEIPLADAPVAVGVGERLHHLLIRGPEVLALAAPISLGKLQHLIVTA